MGDARQDEDFGGNFGGRERKVDSPGRHARYPLQTPQVKGYLDHEKQRPPRTLQHEYAQGPVATLGGGAVSYEQGIPVYDQPLLRDLELDKIVEARFSALTLVNRVSASASRRFALDFCLGGQRSWRASRSRGNGLDFSICKVKVKQCLDVVPISLK